MFLLDAWALFYPDKNKKDHNFFVVIPVQQMLTSLMSESTSQRETKVLFIPLATLPVTSDFDGARHWICTEDSRSSTLKYYIILFILNIEMDDL